MQPTAAEQWAHGFVRHDQTKQNDDTCFKHFDTFTEPQDTWSGVAYECLVGSTWNGLGSMTFNALSMVFASIILIAAVALGILSSTLFFWSESGRDFAIGCGKAFIMVGAHLPIAVKNIIYHAIRAVPIIGYPLSQGINKAAEAFYRIECVQSSFDSFFDYLRSLLANRNNNDQNQG